MRIRKHASNFIRNLFAGSNGTETPATTSAPPPLSQGEKKEEIKQPKTTPNPEGPCQLSQSPWDVLPISELDFYGFMEGENNDTGADQEKCEVCSAEDMLQLCKQRDRNQWGCRRLRSSRVRHCGIWQQRPSCNPCSGSGHESHVKVVRKRKKDSNSRSRKEGGSGSGLDYYYYSGFGPWRTKNRKITEGDDGD